VGRVLLAGLPRARQEAFLDRLNPRPATPRSVTSKPALRRILTTVEKDGYAIAEEEAEIGFCSISVPVRRVGGQVAYALNTGMPVGRATAEQMRSRFLPRLLAEAEALRRLLL
jgi:IclR family pca regulon transcriptional regulator